jgi:hypothetical protein
VKYEIIDHKLIPKVYPVKYISEECVRDPEGNWVDNGHGQPLMRKVEEFKNRVRVGFLFTILKDGFETGEETIEERIAARLVPAAEDKEDGLVEFMTVADLVSLSGQRQFRDALRRYKERLKAEAEGTPEINQAFRDEIERLKASLNAE